MRGGGNYMSDTTMVALIAGVSAILGSLIPQVIILVKEAKNKEHVRQVLIRDKYEELAALIQQSEQWSSSLILCKSEDELAHYNVFEPQRKALILALIYFPEFKAPLSSLALEYSNYFNQHVGRFQKKEASHSIDDLNIVLLTKQLGELLERHSVKYAKA